MKHLWFKKRYVDAILDGSKVDTIRRKRPTVQEGDRVRFSVGPKPAFAEAVIEEIREIAADEIDGARRDRLSNLYDQATLFGEGDVSLWLVRFAVTDVFE